MSGPLTELPIRCDNGHFHMTPPGAVGIGIGIRLNLHSVRYGSCPVCGADGVIEDGTYCVPANFRQRLVMAWSVLRRGYV